VEKGEKLELSAVVQGGKTKEQGGQTKVQGGKPKVQGGKPKVQGGKPKVQGGQTKAQGGKPKVQGGWQLLPSKMWEIFPKMSDVFQEMSVFFEEMSDVFPKNSVVLGEIFFHNEKKTHYMMEENGFYDEKDALRNERTNQFMMQGQSKMEHSKGEWGTTEGAKKVSNPSKEKFEIRDRQNAISTKEHR